MDDNTYHRFCRLIHNLSGIDLGSEKKALLVGRVRRRMRSLNIECHAIYLEHIKNDQEGAEMVHLLNAITTNHTFFFREEFHFQIISSLVKNKLKRDDRKIRIWSAASSSGEEPYSIGMTLLEDFKKNNVQNVDLKILATDISTEILQRAQQGKYCSKRIESVPPELRKRFFDKEGIGDEAIYQVKPELRNLVTYKRLNLSELPYPMRGPFDLIICRNVMIYFDEELRAKLVKEFSKLLAPEGILIVGMTETVIGMSDDLGSIHPSVYQKKTAKEMVLV